MLKKLLNQNFSLMELFQKRVAATWPELTSSSLGTWCRYTCGLQRCVRHVRSAVWYLYLEKLARHGSDRYSCDADLFQIFLYYNLDSVQTGVRSRHRRKTETKLPQNFTKKHFRDLSKHYNFICMYRKYIFYFITWRIHLTFNNIILVNPKKVV